MSEQSNRSLSKWLLVSCCGLIVFGVFGLILLVGAGYVAWLAYMPDDHRAARELRQRGFSVLDNWRDSIIPQINPTHVGGNNLNITPEDSQLISRLPRLYCLTFVGWNAGDMSGLNLEEIGKNCPELTYFRFIDIKHFPPVSDIRWLAACPIKVFMLKAGRTPLNDSDLEVFAGFTKLETLHLHCSSAGITDAGLEHFVNLPSLTHLTLINTSITQEGVEAFREKRPDVEVRLE